MSLQWINIRTGVIASLVTVIAGLAGGYYWFENRFQAELDKRIKPYQNLMVSISIANYGTSDDAARVLGYCIEDIHMKKLPKSHFNIVIDPFLDAVVDAENSARYWKYFMIALPYIKHNMSLNPWRENSIGWIYLYSGEIEESIRHFKRSIRLYGLGKKWNKQHENAGISHWGLAMAYLAKGLPKKSLRHVKLAEQHDSDYQLSSLIHKNEIKSVHWVQKLCDVYYPVFDESLNKLVKEVGDIVKTEKRKKEDYNNVWYYYEEIYLKKR